MGSYPDSLRLPLAEIGCKKHQFCGDFCEECAPCIRPHVYLLESKWERNPLPEADLLIFKGKIEGKSTWTRGLLIALNDVSEQARQAIPEASPLAFL
jgi:hypothetical protein